MADFSSLSDEALSVIINQQALGRVPKALAGQALAGRPVLPPSTAGAQEAKAFIAANPDLFGGNFIQPQVVPGGGGGNNLDIGSLANNIASVGKTVGNAASNVAGQFTDLATANVPGADQLFNSYLTDPGKEFVGVGQQALNTGTRFLNEGRAVHNRSRAFEDAANAAVTLPKDLISPSSFSATPQATIEPTVTLPGATPDKAATSALAGLPTPAEAVAKVNAARPTTAAAPELGDFIGLFSPGGALAAGKRPEYNDLGMADKFISQMESIEGPKHNQDMFDQQLASLGKAGENISATIAEAKKTGILSDEEATDIKKWGILSGAAQGLMSGLSDPTLNRLGVGGALLGAGIGAMTSFSKTKKEIRIEQKQDAKFLSNMALLESQLSLDVMGAKNQIMAAAQDSEARKAMFEADRKMKLASIGFTKGLGEVGRLHEAALDMWQDTKRNNLAAYTAYLQAQSRHKQTDHDYNIAALRAGQSAQETLTAGKLKLAEIESNMQGKRLREEALTVGIEADNLSIAEAKRTKEGLPSHIDPTSEVGKAVSKVRRRVERDSTGSPVLTLLTAAERKLFNKAMEKWRLEVAINIAGSQVEQARLEQEATVIAEIIKTDKRLKEILGAE